MEQHMEQQPHEQVALTAEEAAMEGCLDDLGGDKGKARWQIGSGSLGLLEQVYAVEPFPGLQTRHELSKKLNVSARQVQVWFQNKRQRERKVSRLKGLLSTPGLPDTPAVAAAHAKLAAAGGPKEFPTSAAAPAAGADASSVAAVPAGVAAPTAPFPDDSIGVAPTISTAPDATPADHMKLEADASAVPDSAPASKPSLPLPTPLSMPMMGAGLPMMRSASLDGSALSGLPLSRVGSSSLDPFAAPTSFDDMEIPLGLPNPTLPLPGAAQPHASAGASSGSLRPVALDPSLSAALSGLARGGSANLLSGGMGGSLGSGRGGGSVSSLPALPNSFSMPPPPPPGFSATAWLASLQGSASNLAAMQAAIAPQGGISSLSTEQANEATRVAVQKTRELLSSGTFGLQPSGIGAASGLFGNPLGLGSLGPLPLLQSFLPSKPDGLSGPPTGAPLASSSIHGSNGLCRPSAFPAAELGAPPLNPGAMDHEMSDIGPLDAMAVTDTISDEFAEELQQELLGGLPRPRTVPHVQNTPSTSEVMSGCAHAASGTAASHGGGGGGGSGGGVGGGAGAPSGKARWQGSDFLTGVPMARSGVSNLFDDLNLEFGNLPAGDSAGPAQHSAAAPPPSAQSSASAAHAPPMGGTIPEESGAQPTAAAPSTALLQEDTLQQRDALQQTEVMQQKEADRYVQVITAAKEPFEIVWASEAWLRLCEYKMPQVIGRTLELIQGPQTTRDSIDTLMGAIRSAEAVTLSMINSTRSGKAFSHTLRVEPLRDSAGNVQCFQATSSSIEEGVTQAAAASSSASTASAEETHASSTKSGRGPMGSRQSSQTSISDMLNFDEKAPTASASAAKSSTDGRATGTGAGGVSVSMSPRGMMPRSGSELEISEMLDLFDQESGLRSPMPSATR